MYAPQSLHLGRVAIGIVALALSMGAVAQAQSAIPSVPVPPSQPASPQPTANANGWEPIRFVAAPGFDLTIVSSCGIPGVDTFHLELGNPLMSGWVDITLTDFDAANLRYTGREVGQMVGANDSVDYIDGGVAMSFDINAGMWYLKASYIDLAPIEVCTPLPSPGA